MSSFNYNQFQCYNTINQYDITREVETVQPIRYCIGTI